MEATTRVYGRQWHVQKDWSSICIQKEATTEVDESNPNPQRISQVIRLTITNLAELNLFHLFVTYDRS